MAEKVELFTLIGQQCTSAQIAGFLKKQKWAAEDDGDEDSDILVSGTKEKLVDHLRTAVKDRAIKRSQVLELLRESEENGDQYILNYHPKERQTIRSCNDSEMVADALFGDSRAAFPLFDRVPNKYIWSDFRADRSWTAKIYGHETEYTATGGWEQTDDGRWFTPHSKSEHRTTCLVRWTEAELLEIRIPRGDSEDSPLTRLDTVWSMLRSAFKRSEFIPWSLKKLRRRLIAKRTDSRGIYHLPTLRFVGDGSHTVTVGDYLEEEGGEPIPQREATIDQYKNADCKRLVVLWYADGSNEALDHNLRTILSSRLAEDFLIIPSKTSSRAVEYVLDKLEDIGG